MANDRQDSDEIFKERRAYKTARRFCLLNFQL